MDIVLIAKGNCSFYYIDLHDGNSIDEFFEAQDLMSDAQVADFFAHLENVVEVAGCPRSLSDKFYKPIRTGGKNPNRLYEIRKGRIRLICHEYEPDKTIFILSAFIKEGKKEQSKNNRFANDTTMKHVKEAFEESDIVWKTISDAEEE